MAYGEPKSKFKVAIWGNGIFEYIIEADGKTVNHRLFVPDR